LSEVKVLIEGYAKKVKGGWIASSTVTLVKSNGKTIIVDPGCNRRRLMEALEKEHLRTSDVDYVMVTHNHADHYLLAGIFENAKILNWDEIYYDDLQLAHGNLVPGTDVTIIRTPGHTPDHSSLIVPTNKGVCVVAGDLFWWVEGEKQKIQITRKDQAHQADMKSLIASRKKILKISDFIIPGHGKMMENKLK
jgi:glyoxylase-like metal-dependent hydrolase (beta-lactamase superfamily II)